MCSSCRNAHKKFPKLRDHEVQQLSSNPPMCTTCKSGDIVREASCFCKDCGEYLCNACKTDHKKFKKLRGHIIVDVKEQGQHGDKSKHTGPFLAGDKLQTSGPETIGLQTPPADGGRNDRGLQASAPATESHSSAKSEYSASLSKPFNILNMSLKTVTIVDPKTTDDESMRVHGCVFMPSGDLFLANQYEGEVLHLDSSFTILEKLELSTLDIAVLSENIAVAIADSKLQFLEVTPKLRLIKSVPLDWSSSFARRGMAAGGGLIYVSCYKGDDDKGHIKVLDSSGKEIRRINAIQKGKALFDKPYHLAASTTRVYTSGEALTCLKSDGTLVYQYRDEKLGKISGMVVDCEDNVLVCAYKSVHKAKDKFHVIMANGKRHISKALEKSIDIPGYNCSDCLSFRPSDRTLAMGALSQLYIFKTA